MFLTIIHQCRDQHFRAILDALDLELHEIVGTLAHRFGGAHPFLLDLRLDLRTQGPVGNANKTPRLHQADTGRLMRRTEQPRQQFRRDRTAAEVTHVPAFGNGAIHRSAFIGAEGLVIHGLKSAATA